MNTQSFDRPRLSRRILAAAFLLVFAFAFASGCEHKSRGGNSGGSAAREEAPAEESRAATVVQSSIVGSWKLSASDGSYWFAHFAADGTWKITDDAEGAARRVYGTYSCDGNRFSGPMVNPHVGEGRIEGSFDGDAMTMDFIEYWHEPAKHVPYAGTKL